MPAIENFRYHAVTKGASWRFTLPLEEAMPTHAAVALPEKGGFVSSIVEKYNFRDIFMFDRAVAFASGSYCEKSDCFDATASVMIEGLNILNMVTADRVVARIASSHAKDGSEPQINPLGTYFENLRIAGHKVEVDLAVDTFAELDTHTGFRAASKHEDPVLRDEVLPHVLGTDASGAISCTLVRSIRGLGREIKQEGHLIRIRDFGVLRLAELTMSERKRSMTMLQFHLGSTPAGAGDMGGVEGNGSGN
jgi:hypothetical protein